MSEVVISATPVQLVEAARARLVSTLSTAQHEHGSASVVLTGGSNGIALLRALRDDSGGLDWSALDIYWGDERFIPDSDPQRNAGQARQALLDHVPADPDRVHVIAASDGKFGDDIDAAARAYAAVLSVDGVVGPFDIHLLGMGGEGHINSLFPHSAALTDAANDVVSVRDSPKPPPQRVTLTLRAVNRSRQVWFLVSGADKAAAAAAGINGGNLAEWPCAGAHGTERTVWFLDESAATKL